MDNKLKPRPFCGGEATIQVCDDEGNKRTEEYEENPWSGLSYKLVHKDDDNPDCPIAGFAEDGGTLGTYLYGTREEAIAAWNHRYQPPAHKNTLDELKELESKCKICNQIIGEEGDLYCEYCSQADALGMESLTENQLLLVNSQICEDCYRDMEY